MKKKPVCLKLREPKIVILLQNFGFTMARKSVEGPKKLALVTTT